MVLQSWQCKPLYSVRQRLWLASVFLILTSMFCLILWQTCKYFNAANIILTPLPSEYGQIITEIFIKMCVFTQFRKMHFNILSILQIWYNLLKTSYLHKCSLYHSDLSSPWLHKIFTVIHPILFGLH